MASAVVGGLIGQLLARAGKRKEGKKPSGSHKGGLHPKRKQKILRPLQHKVPKSFVATKQKMPRNSVANDGQGNERLSATHGRRHKPLKRSMEHKIREALVPENTSLFESTQRMTTGRGRSSYTVFEVGTPADIDSCRANADGMIPAPGLDSAKNGKLHLKDCSMKLTMTNASSGLAYLRIYEYVSRKPMPSSLTGINDVVQNGFGDNYTSQITNASLGGTLFANPRFCVYNKIVKVRTVQLGCGRSFEYNLSNKKSKVFNPIYDNAFYNLSHAGYTRGVVVQLFCQPVNYTNSGDIITSDDGKVDVIQLKKYHWSVLVFPMSGTFITTTVPTEAGNLELIDAVGDRQNDVQA